MNLNKYKNMFLEKLKNQIFIWFESDDEKPISISEVYHFLHSIKGTSGTLGLEEFQQISEKLLQAINTINKDAWKRNELRQFLNELIILTHNYDCFEQAEVNSARTQVETIPLIQIIDNDVSILIPLKEFLESKGWMVITNSTPEKAISQYLDLNPDCVIIDASLPETHGFEIIQALQQYSNKQFVPIIMISTLKDRNTRIKAYETGADDFLEKPLDLEELAVHIKRHLQRKQIYGQSSLLDELTNLYNRRYLKVAYKRFLNDLKRSEEPFCLAMLDLDYFKRVNDSYGHHIGDKVLSGFSAFLMERTRGNDLAFRYGGEEFTLLLQNTNDLQASEIITRLLDEFSKICFNANGEEFSITFSAGIHMIENPETTLEDALSVADQALYRAKELGRARVESMNNPLSISENRKLYISIVDDDPIIQTLLFSNLQMLKGENYDIHVQAFEDGISFFNSNRLEKRGDHFLILDGVMPIMDGLEILEKVKQTDYGNNVLVMMLTGRDSESDIARALELGADDYITKPFNLENLQFRIKQLIHRIKN